MFLIEGLYTYSSKIALDNVTKEIKKYINKRFKNKLPNCEYRLEFDPNGLSFNIIDTKKKINKFNYSYRLKKSINCGLYFLEYTHININIERKDKNIELLKTLIEICEYLSLRHQLVLNATFLSFCYVQEDKYSKKIESLLLDKYAKSYTLFFNHKNWKKIGEYDNPVHPGKKRFIFKKDLNNYKKKRIYDENTWKKIFK